MATPQNREVTKVGSDKGTTKKNYTAIRYGNDHGDITFGRISKQGDVTSDVSLQASEGTHYVTLDKDGPREGWTTIAAPANIQIDCGRTNEKKQDTFMLFAENGNIVIKADNGKIRFEANDIEFDIKGDDGTEGNFKVFASESILFESKKVQVTAKNFIKLASPGKIELAANETLKLYGGVIRGVTDACSTRDSKLGGRQYWKENQ
jgi:lipopolysaccharide assembly outer membrane protein LptD (OstA)